MEEVYDYLIVGGGPAGSTAACYLRLAGKRVAVVEKEKFPRAHVGESLLPFCFGILKDVGVLERVRQEFVTKPGVRFNNSEGTKFYTSCFSEHIKDESHLSFHVRRDLFDKILLDRARDLGARVFEGYAVISTKHFDGATFVKATNSHDEIIIRTNFVIDASGQSAFLAKKSSNRKALKGLKKIAFSAHWKGAAKTHGLESGLLNIFHLGKGRNNGWAWLIPISEDMASVGVVLDIDYLKDKKKAATSNKALYHQIYLDEIDGSDKLKEVLSEAVVASNVVVNSNYSQYSTSCYGEWYAMVGDAYKFVDPIFATGVLMSMKSSKYVTEALIKFGPEGLSKAYERIGSAYGLVEDMIRSYYNTKTVDFHEFEGLERTGYGVKESAFRLVHGLLAGDLFEKGDAYGEFFEKLKEQEVLEGYYHLIHKSHKKPNSC